MKNYFGKNSQGLIFAADMPTSDENFVVLDRIVDQIDVIKLSGFLALKEGMGCIGRFRKRYDKPIFADLKVADVPHTNVKIVEMAREQGAAAVMVHGIVGPDGIEDCIKAAGGDLGIILQIELTNPGGLMFTAPLAEDIAALAATLDVFGVQAPGNRPDKIAKIRSIVGPEKVLVCCGVGRQGGTYRGAIAAGGSFPIVGRAIYEAADPLAAVAKVRAA